jgi:predicted lipase
MASIFALTNDSRVPLVTDANFVLAIPSPILFPSLPFGVLAHSGFLDTHAATASHVLTAVQATLSKYGSTTVITVGHSLGAAIALLDAVYLPMHLPSTISFKTYAFGLPRVGDPAFAAFVDSAASNVQLTHVNNMKDPGKCSCLP